jgi:hypothetical protein
MSYSHLVFVLPRLHTIHYPITVDPISIPLLTTSMLGATTVWTAIVIFVVSDWGTIIPTSCLQVSTIVAFDMIGEVVFTWGWWCSILWLPIGILCGVECGCKYTSISLLVVWINERICQLYDPNWLPNSMLLILLWTTWIFNSCSYGWNINVLTTFCNSTCLAIFALMWKGTKRQFMIACPSSS